MQRLISELTQIKLLARISTPNAEINVLRQGFILLMTAFDAAIFDLVRIRFRADFHTLIANFAKRRQGLFKGDRSGRRASIPSGTT